jgi:DNA polymerase I-like protein with 3'-5' exonuclease and polymerase domains
LSLDNVSLHLIDSFDEVQEFFRWLSRGQRTHVAIDTETSGLVIGQDHVRMTQVGWTDAGWAIPQHRWSGILEDLVARFDGRYVMHNAKFDFGHLVEDGIEIPTHKIDDTRIMSHILEPNFPTALKSQATRYVDPMAAAMQATLNDAIGKRGGWTWGTVPITYAPYWQYGALDPVLTAHIFEHHWPLVQAEAPDAYELENAVQWVIYRMERYGAHIDTNYAKNAYNTFMHDCEQIDKMCKDTYGFTAGQNIQIIKQLQEEGHVFSKATASGAVSLDKEVLGGIDHPLAQAVLRRRQRQKLATTYLHHFITETDENHLIHPSINTLGARTSRMSMERPNLQNLPRKSEQNKDAETIRNCFDTRYGPDGKLLFCDFDQIEMRLLGHLSQDAGLIKAFHSENDFFVELARAIFMDPDLVKKDPRRSVTKNVGYAEIYGAGIAKMAKTAGVPEEQVRVVKTRFDTLYPGVKRFKNAVEHLAWQRKRDEGISYAKSPITKRHHVADENKVYALVNYLIQGTAAEVFKKALLKLDSAGLGKFMVVPVHDEIVLDVPLTHFNEAVEALRDNMNDRTSFAVPITASVASGYRWGAKEDL